jgi:hypothetical protein
MPAARSTAIIVLPISAASNGRRVPVLLSQETEHISANLRKVLNTHGHAFHYAIIRRAEELHSEQRSRWIFDGAEFPVSVRGVTTHVDLILTTRSERTVLVGECKRVDPARASWCFAHAPYTWRDSYDSEVVFDCLMLTSGGTATVRSPKTAHSGEPVYQMGFELKTDQKGTGLGQSDGAIDKAVAQVLRSTSGLLNHLAKNTKSLEVSTGLVTVIPTVFTTAELWTTNVDLANADLRSGNLLADSLDVVRTNWLWYSHNRSPALEADPEINKLDKNQSLLGISRFSDDLRRLFARTVV